MIGSALGFLAGHCLVHLLPVLPDARIGGGAMVVALAAAIVLRLRVVAACLLGIGWAWLNAAALLRHDLPAALEGVDLSVRGYIASLPELTDAGPRFLFDVLPEEDPSAHRLERVELTWYDAPVVPAAGERWQFVVRLRQRRGFANPGGYDYEAQLFRERIGATGYVRDSGDNRRLAEPSARYAVLRLRGWLAGRLAQALPAHPMLGIVQGLAVGERQNITAPQWRVFAATGTSHLMAISGLHIAMVAALLAGCGALANRLPGAQARGFTAVDGRAIGGIAGAAAYTALAGFAVPAQRTLVMLVVYFGARLLRRELAPAQGLAVSLIAVLLLDPLAPLSIGAWLSFGAVAAIFLFLHGRPRVTAQSATRRQLRDFLGTQWAVTVGLLPLLALSFGTVSVVAPFVNLAAIPFFTLLAVPAVLLGTAGMVLWPAAGQAVLQATAWLLDGMWWLLEKCAGLDLAVVHLSAAPAWAMALMIAGALVLLAPGFLSTRLAGLLLCLPALLWRPAPLTPGEFRLTLLDVGQGLAAVVQTRSHTLVYDAGPAFRSGRDTGEMVVLPFLYARAVRHIDLLIASHGDLDHVGGVPAVLAGLPVRRVLAGGEVKLGEAVPDSCHRGLTWRWDAVEFAILHPQEGQRIAGDNDASCVLAVRGAGGSALLTGDVEQRSEHQLVEAGVISPTSIVVAAHHGSRSSSTAALVDAVRAEYVLFAAGHRNRWGFPRPDVVARWSEAGARPYSTAASGAIEFTVRADGIGPVMEWRRQYRRYWHAADRDP